MSRFSRKFKRNPDRVTFDKDGAPVFSDFEGKKAQEKQIRKMFFKAQQEYWRQLKAGLITEDGEPINSEDIEVDVEVDLEDSDEQE